MTEQTSSNQTNNQNPNLTLTLSLKEVNIVLSALQEIPFKLADPVLKKIVPQAEQQIKAIERETFSK